MGRSALKRQTILSAGRGLFVSNGYQKTSVDQIAASVEVSKQTVYKHFGDKQELLLAIVNTALETTVTPFLGRIAALAETTDLHTDLTEIATAYLRAVLQEPVVQLRRLVWVRRTGCRPWLSCITSRHPPTRSARSPIASPACTTEGAECARTALGCGAFRIPDRRAIHRPGLFCGGPQVLTELDVDHYVGAGLRVFLAAHQPRTG